MDTNAKVCFSYDSIVATVDMHIILSNLLLKQLKCVYGGGGEGDHKSRLYVL